MSVIRGKVEATITLSKATCYFMKTGKCSLNLIDDHFLPAGKVAANDLMYCPRLYKAMLAKEQNKPLTALRCSCGHVEVLSGHQRACIASRTGLRMTIQFDPDRQKEDPVDCSLCNGQITFENKNSGGVRVVTLRAAIEPPKDTDGEAAP